MNQKNEMHYSSFIYDQSIMPEREQSGWWNNLRGRIQLDIRVSSWSRTLRSRLPRWDLEGQNVYEQLASDRPW